MRVLTLNVARPKIPKEVIATSNTVTVARKMAMLRSLRYTIRLMLVRGFTERMTRSGLEVAMCASAVRMTASRCPGRVRTR